MSIDKIIMYLKCVSIEMLIWPLGIIFLFMIDPHAEHLSLCPLENMGFEYCPGCGLGRSISFLFLGDFASSFKTHPLGIFAIVVLVYRTYYLINLSIKEFLNKRQQS